MEYLQEPYKQLIDRFPYSDQALFTVAYTIAHHSIFYGYAIFTAIVSQSKA